MTYLSQDLNKICKNWCPIIEQCPEGHFCRWMDQIRERIIIISDFREFEHD